VKILKDGLSPSSVKLPDVADVVETSDGSAETDFAGRTRAGW
jgi:hypothetical protein